MEIAAPRYPIYVISKGRADSRLTIRALEIAGVEHQVVIEPQEFDAYAKHVPPHRIRVLPFSNLGQGSIPARNWVWEDAIAAGATRHWILDDNIRCFYRLHENRKVYFQSGQFFSLMENFADAYTNLGLVGPNYSMMAPRKETRLNPYKLNTRIYSCILIRNDLPFRWRGRYNEDTDLSLRVLKAGYCTALFNALLACKIGTMSMKGGNTEELYRGRAGCRWHFILWHSTRTLRRSHGDGAGGNTMSIIASSKISR